MDQVYTSRLRIADPSSYDNDGNDDKITACAAEFANQVPKYKFTAAEIQGYLLQHKESPENAVKGIDTWVKERMASNLSMKN
ncbi:hypothetical protein ACJ73_06686 [Blastomyces percursus]|uniref:Mitochondrial chaperone BCS1-like ATPase lid domain-containing protein n=1 Tax=Blastomyces percursus TaxID=1658174 RepID=A0A1J9R1T1_9EURO|nr:hypothetical protein ACJ73_06686 [Blastomyces percursus]